MNQTSLLTKLRPKSAFLAVLLIISAQPAHAVIVLNYQQTGANVTAFISGTIDAAWGASTFDSGAAWSGGYTDAYGGFGLGLVRVGYGQTSGHDIYTFFGTTAVPAIGGSQLTGGVVQSGYSPNLFSLDIASGYVGLTVSPGTTSVNASIVWSDKLLSDFFSSGVPVVTDVYNASNEQLLTLQIGNPAPAAVPEPGTWAAAALLMGGAAFARWRKRAKVS